MAKEIQLTKSLHFFIYVIVMVLLIGIAVLLYNLQGVNDVSGQAVDPFNDFSCVTNDDCFSDEVCIDGFCVFVGEMCVPNCASNQECVDGMCFDIIDDFEDYDDINDFVSAEGDVLGQNNVNDYVASNQNTIPNNQVIQQNIQETPKKAIGGSCSITADCISSVCDSNNGKCVECYKDENCAITDYCDLMAKQCKKGCRSNYDCLSNERCINGDCIVDPNSKQIPKQGAFIGEATTPKTKTILTAESNLKGDSSSQKVTVVTGSIQNKSDEDSLGGFAWAAIIFVTIGMFTAMVVVMHNHEKKHAQSINSPNTTQQPQGYQQQSQFSQEPNQLYQNQQYQNQGYQNQQFEPELYAPDKIRQPSQVPQQQYQQKNIIDSNTDKQFLNYAKILLDQGMNKDEAVQQLVNSGWNKNVLEQLFNQHASLLITSGERQQIENYIRYYVKKGLQKESIKQGLTNAGWSMEVINDIMQEF